MWLQYCWKNNQVFHVHWGITALVLRSMCVLLWNTYFLYPTSSHLTSSPFFSLSPSCGSRNPDPEGHRAGSRLPPPHYGSRRAFSSREYSILHLCSLADSRRMLYKTKNRKHYSIYYVPWYIVFVNVFPSRQSLSSVITGKASTVITHKHPHKKKKTKKGRKMFCSEDVLRKG